MDKQCVEERVATRATIKQAETIEYQVTDVSQFDENEAEVRFAVGLHSFDDIDSLIDALKRSIPNGTENGIVVRFIRNSLD